MTHLLLPLAASILFVVAMIFAKRASLAGIRPLTFLFFSNLCASGVFSFLWLLGGEGANVELWWQPAIVALLYLIGLSFTFLAVEKGDVSVATPIFGMKVVGVALLLTVIESTPVRVSIWIAAVLATTGIGMIQWTGQGKRHHVWMTIGFALSAACSFATFDVLVQQWSPSWGAGRFLPAVYWIVGLASLVLIPWVQWSMLRRPEILRMLIPAAVFVALQSFCIVLALGLFGDAARINVVYALRGLWGVGLAYLAARIWGGSEASLTRSTMVTRFLGAVILTAAVVVVIVAG